MTASLPLSHKEHFKDYSQLRLIFLSQLRTMSDCCVNNIFKLKLIWENYQTRPGLSIQTQTQFSWTRGQEYNWGENFQLLCKIKWILERGQFWPKGHDLNKLSSTLPDNAIHDYDILALSTAVSDKRMVGHLSLKKVLKLFKKMKFYSENEIMINEQCTT